MKAKIYKFIFLSPVHFGNGTLESSGMTFSADTLFSAFFTEAVAMGDGESELLKKRVSENGILFSDAFPFAGDMLYLPKPARQIRADKDESSRSVKKKYKKLEYIPMDCFAVFLEGNFDIESYTMPEFGRSSVKTQVSLRGEEQSVPYRVGTFSFDEDCGLYIILSYETEEDEALMNRLMERLSYSGIGGKRYSGMGKFDYLEEDIPEEYAKRIDSEAKEYMQLSVGYPADVDLDRVIEGASYVLCKRSGFIASAEYAEQAMRKTDAFLFAAGSCFRERYCGVLMDVSGAKGSHPVYRYAKPLFMGVDI